ncbi:MAG: alanine racemase [Patescibacteria group bacterium]
MKRPVGLRTWIDVDTKALRHNVKVFRTLIGRKRLLMAVVKSNAYGHSLIDAAHFFEKNGADWLGVDSVVEGVALRRAGIKKPILVLGHTLPEKYPDLVSYDLRATISSFEGLALVVQYSKLKIHIKIDSGMHRQGFQESDFEQLCAYIKVYPKLKKQIEGLYTHFASAKNPAFPRDTKNQIAIFELISTMFDDVGIEPMRHAAASSGTIVFPESYYDMVRVGISLYGLWPSHEVEMAFSDRMTLKPALSWRSVIGEIKTVLRGARFGYDLTESLPRGGRIAIVPVGYWHGYPRALSSIGRVLIHGKEAKVLGRVSMDMLIIDISKIKDAKTGDVVTLIGQDGKASISVDFLAELAGTSSYELVTRLNPLIHRIYH